jgi:hypothetical protein
MNASLFEHEPVPLVSLAALMCVGLAGFLLARKRPWTAWLVVAAALALLTDRVLALGGSWVRDVGPEMTQYFHARLALVILTGVVALGGPMAGAALGRRRGRDLT